jgi:uncharacterized membrane protein
MVAVGITHFTAPGIYVAMVPPQLPSPLLLVYLSGVAEIAGGIGLTIPPLRRAASIGLIALYIAVFPANVYMALAELPFGGHPVAPWLLWARLPLQAVFIVWAFHVGQLGAAPKLGIKDAPAH